MITNIPNQVLKAYANSNPVIQIGPSIIKGLARSYADRPPGKLLAITGSSGYLEIARNLGRAENPPAVQMGTRISVTLISESRDDPVGRRKSGSID